MYTEEWLRTESQNQTNFLNNTRMRGIKRKYIVEKVKKKSKSHKEKGNCVNLNNKYNQHFKITTCSSEFDFILKSKSSNRDKNLKEKVLIKVCEQ